MLQGLLLSGKLLNMEIICCTCRFLYLLTEHTLQAGDSEATQQLISCKISNNVVNLVQYPGEYAMDVWEVIQIYTGNWRLLSVMRLAISSLAQLSIETPHISGICLGIL